MSELEFKLRFLIIPDFIYSDARLNATDIKVYSFINSYKGSKFYFTNDQLGEMFNTSHDSISRSMVRLSKFGYIEVNYEIKSGGGKIRFVRNRKVAESENADSLSLKTQHLDDKDNKIKEINTFTKVNETSSTGMKKLGDVIRNLRRGQEVKPTSHDNRIAEGWQHYAHEVVELAGFKNGGRARIFQAFKSKNYGYTQVEKAKQVIKHKNYLDLKSEDDRVRYLMGAFRHG